MTHLHGSVTERTDCHQRSRVTAWTLGRIVTGPGNLSSRDQEIDCKIEQTMFYLKLHV